MSPQVHNAPRSVGGSNPTIVSYSAIAVKIKKDKNSTNLVALICIYIVELPTFVLAYLQTASTDVKG
jgi:hypothetical protein